MSTIDLRPLTGPNRAHTPSDVGQTYATLVHRMELHKSKQTKKNISNTETKESKDITM